MEKIFNPDVEGYLLESGVSKKEIAKIKFNRLKELAIERLVEVENLLKTEKFDQIEKLTIHSNSGDGWGNENDFIDFGFIISEKGSLDILELCELLKQFKNIMK